MFGLSTEVITNGKLATLKDLSAGVLIALHQSKISALRSHYGEKIKKNQSCISKFNLISH